MKELRPLTLFLATALAACGGDTAEQTTAAVVDTVAGVERYSYPAEPAGNLGWAVDTVAVLGDAFADDAYQFDQVVDGGLASDAEGNLYVLDRQGKRVLKYGPGGEHLGTFGREGEGPGELNQPMGLAVGPGDTLWVSDFSNTRVTGLPQGDGDPVTIALPSEDVIPGQRLAALRGEFLTTLNQLMMFRPSSSGRMELSRGDGEDGEAVRKIPVMRLDRSSLEPLDTLWASVEPPRDMVQIEAGGNVRIAMMSREFYPDFMWDALSDGGIVVSDSASYSLHLIGPDGEIIRSVRREPAPRATTEADREFARERVREESQGGGVRVGGGGPDEGVQAEMLRQRLENMTFAELIPRVVELRVDPSDRIWVGVTEDTPGEVDRIDLYDRDGTLLGELRDFPFPDVFLGPDRIGVLRRDDLDVQQIVILELQRPQTEVAGG